MTDKGKPEQKPDDWVDKIYGTELLEQLKEKARRT